MNPDAVIITHHAAARFVSRYSGETPTNVYQAIRELLAKSQPDNIGAVGRAVRMINNSFAPAKYYTVGGWRFVLTEDEQILLTCERKWQRTKVPAKKRRARK